MSRFSPGNQRDGVTPQEELPGVTVDWDWSGFSRKGNRRSIGPNYFWTAENIRLDGGDARSRRGIAKVNTGDSSANTCILGMTDVRTLNLNSRLLIALGNYCYLYQPSFNKSTVYDLNPDASAGDAANVGGYIVKHKSILPNEDDGKPEFRTSILTNLGNKLTVKLENEGSITASTTSRLYFPTPDGNQVSFPTPYNAEEASATNVPFDRTGSNDLWWANSNNIYRYNDTGVYVEASSLTNASILGSLNEQLFVACNPLVEGSSDGFYYRAFDGTWTGVTAPTYTYSGSGSSDEFIPLGWTYYKGKALIHGYVQNTGGTGTWFGAILVWDGSSLTVGHITSGTIGNSEADPLGVVDATVHSDGNYYFTWTTQGTDASYIGKYNNSTFDDTNIDVDAIASTTAHYPTAIGSVGGYLVFVADVGGSGGQEFWRSQNLSSWTELSSSGDKNSTGNTADTVSSTVLV